MNKKFKLALVPFAVSLLLTGCSESNTTAKTAGKVESGVQSAENIDKSIKANSVISLANSTAEWQLSHLDDLSYIPESHRAKSENPKFWIQASFYIGLTRWAETTDNKDYLRFIQEMAKEQNYELLLDRPYHADDHTIGQTYLWLTEQTGNKEAYKPTQELFDKILANPPKVG